MNTPPLHRILQPENWKPAKGYANGSPPPGRTIYLGGQIGWNGDQQFETDDSLPRCDRRWRTSWRSWPKLAGRRNTLSA